MATTSYLISKNNGDLTTLSAAGIKSAQLVFRANGLDKLTLGMTLSSMASIPTYAFGDVVAIIKRVGDGETTTDTCKFVGTVEEVPRQGIGGGPQTHTFVVYGPSYGLQLCDFSQQWSYNNGTVKVKDYEATVCLGEDNSGNRIGNGKQIEEVIDYAIVRGLNIQKGSIATGVNIPFDERQNITCWDAIVSMLRYTPDYVFRWDYSTVDGSGDYCPTAQLIAPASMATVSKAKTDLSTASFVPRYDIRVPGILIQFFYEGDVDGVPLRVRTQQTAGDYTNARRVSLVYNLEGEHQAFVKQEVESEAYPDDWTTSEGKAILQKIFPGLAAGYFTVDSVSRSGDNGLTYRLVQGSITPWMSKDSETQTITATVKLSGSAFQNNSTAVLKATVTSTDAQSKEYTMQTEFVAPEPVPSDLATNLYASWNRLHYDGEISFKEQTLSMDIMPGNKINVTGSITEWAAMASIVQNVSYDLFGGATAVSGGTCGRLEADNLMSIYRAARGRSYCYRRLARDSDANVNDIEGAGATPNDNESSGLCREFHELQVDIDGTYKEIGGVNYSRRCRLDPEPTGSSTLAEHLYMQFREIYLPSSITDKKITWRKHYVLCSDGYSDEDDIIHVLAGAPTAADQVMVSCGTDYASWETPTKITNL